MSTTGTALRKEEDLRAFPCVGETLNKLVHPAVLTVLAEAPIHGYRLADQWCQTPNRSLHGLVRGNAAPHGGLAVRP
jgi:hypothetical protein